MKGERRSTTKITLRIRPSVVEDLKELAERWDVTLSDLVATGLNMIQMDPINAAVDVSEMKTRRLLETGHKAFPRKPVSKKRRTR